MGIAPPHEKDFVKRVIATGGQTVACCDAAGWVTVDGRPLDEPYLYEDRAFEVGTEDCTTAPRSQRCFGPVTVQADSLWLIGDHRSGSGDSTLGCRGDAPVTACRGPVPVDNVIGHAVLVVSPVSRWDVTGSPDLRGRS